MKKRSSFNKHLVMETQATRLINAQDKGVILGQGFNPKEKGTTVIIEDL